MVFYMTRTHSILRPAELALTELALLPGIGISPLADSKCNLDNVTRRKAGTVNGKR